MKPKEIFQLFEYIYEEYITIKPEYEEVKLGYFMAMMEIFSQLTEEIKTKEE